MASSDIDLKQLVTHDDYRGSVIREKEKEGAVNRHIRLARFYATMTFAGFAFLTVFAGLCYMYMTTSDAAAKGWIQAILLSTFTGAAVALGIQINANVRE